MDIFSDDGTHAVFLELGLGAKMQAMLKAAQRAAASLEPGEDSEHLSEVMSNVAAFLEYKKQQK